MAKAFSGGYSALGNYVHFNPNNYKKYGIYWQGMRRKPRELKDGTWKYYSTDVDEGTLEKYKYNHAQSNAWVDSQIEKMRINPATLEELKKRLSLFSAKNEKSDESALKKKEQIMMKAVFEVLARTTNLDRVGAIVGTKDRSANFNISKEEYEGLFNQNLKFIKSQVDKNNDKMNTQEKVSTEWLFKQGYGKMKQAYQKMIDSPTEKNIQNFVKAMETLLAKIDVSKLSSEFGKINKNDIKSLQGFVELYDLTGRYNSSKYTVLGNFGEVLTSFLDDAVYNMAVDNADKAVKDYVDHAFTYGGWKGEKQSQFSMQPHQIVGDSKNLTAEMKDDYGSLFKVQNSQNKIDTSITINGDNIGASIKSYFDPSKGLGIQKGSKESEGGVSLLNTLVALNTQIPYFGTHWMNRHVKGSKVGSKKMDKLLKKYIVYQAFSTGNTLKGSEPAKVLIIYNTSTGSVGVVDIAKLLLSDFKKLGVTLKPENISEITISNRDFASNGKRATRTQIERRLVQNILDLRQKKINVTYYPKENIFF